jgi:hypothetical protein
MSQESEATFNVEEVVTRYKPGMKITAVNLESNIRIRDTIVCTAHIGSTHMFLVLLMYAANFRVQLTLNPSSKL